MDVHCSQLESVALLQQRQQYEVRITALDDELAAALLQLRQNTERSAKLRLHNERQVLCADLSTRA